MVRYRYRHNICHWITEEDTLMSKGDRDREHPFKVGDIIECLEAPKAFKINSGCHYVILKCFESAGAVFTVSITADDGKVGTYSANRFIIPPRMKDLRSNYLVVRAEEDAEGVICNNWSDVQYAYADVYEFYGDSEELDNFRVYKCKEGKIVEVQFTTSTIITED